MSTAFAVQASEPDNYYGYRRFKKGAFEFHRDEYFVHIRWPKGTHTMAADIFLRALQRDIAWNFFYGTVNFDGVSARSITTAPSTYSPAVSTTLIARPGATTTRPTNPKI
jgi:hypothetical protein